MRLAVGWRNDISPSSSEVTMDLDLTKAGIAKLSEKEQETIARLALDRGRIEREIQERGSRYPGQVWVPAVLGVAGTIAAGQISRMADTPRTLTSVITGIIVLLLMVIHSLWGSNRRMDAMFRLIKEQEKEANRAKGTRDQGHVRRSEVGS
jgi:hypothetical protein